MRLVTFFTVLCSLTLLPGQDRPGWEMTDAELAVAANQIRAGKSLLPESWPGGARVAVLLSFDVDNDTSRLASGRPPSIGAMSQGEYGARVGLKRVVELIDRYEIPATFFTPAVSLLLRPDMIDVIQASGRHEFGVHGWIHEQNSGLPLVLERQLVERAIHYLEEATGERPVGYRAPSWNFSPNTLGIIREMGLMYDSSLMADDAPYEILASGDPTGIVEIPVEWILDDAPLMNPRGQSYTPPREMLRVFIDEFEKAYEEGTMLVLTMHPHIIGHRSRIVILEELIEHIKGFEGVWFATHRAAAEIARQQLTRPAAESYARQVDTLLEPFDLEDGPGGAVGVYRDGGIVYARGYGLANIEHGIANSPSTVFRIGSVTKQFVAMAIAMLHKDGALSLDDDIRRHVPEMPEYEQPITVRHLVHHTSGLRDYNELATLSGLRADRLGTVQEALALIARQGGLNFAPGEQYLYSNSGYFLMAVIVERVSGKTMAEFAQERIFGPLGMTSSLFKDDRDAIVRRRAYGYVPENRGYRMYMSQRDFVGAGGVFTSIQDMLRWDNAFYDSPAWSSDLIDLTLTRGRLNEGSEIPYGFGLQVGEYRGLRTVAHSGSFAAFTAQLLRFPDQRLTVVTMRNGGSSNASRLARQIAEIYLRDQFTESAVLPRAPMGASARGGGQAARRASPEELAAYTGRYYSQELDTTYLLEVVDGILRAGPVGLTPRSLRRVGEDVFGARGRTIRFQREGGSVSGFSLDGGRVRGLAFARMR